MKTELHVKQSNKVDREIITQVDLPLCVPASEERGIRNSIAYGSANDLLQCSEGQRKVDNAELQVQERVQ